jgi:hypothetical protein
MDEVDIIELMRILLDNDSDGALAFMRLPLLGKLLARLAMPSNVYIAHEDRRVVVTQQPKASSLKIGEILIQGDLPIVEYRRKRAALQDR